MAANIAQAYITITPKFTGFKQAVESELSGVTSSGYTSGQKLGNAFSSGANGLVKSGALVGAFSAITTSALSAVSSHLTDAISRFDTLNNYPVVMQTLGYSAETAEASISKMSDRLQTLPTTLDSMASTVQGITAVTGDLSKATDVGLALNDMLVAGGSSAQLCSAAMEQFRQILSKGTPEMQDWKSLVQAMPGQMNQLAQSMLGPTANANDLYTALGGGKAVATITMDELMDKMVELDTTGGGAITSFKEQAETAAGGVATSMSNMQNAITKGIAGVMDEIGKETIAGVFDDMKVGINQAFSVVKGAVASAKPALTSVYEVFKGLVPTIASLVVSMTTLKAAMGVASVVQGAVSSVRNLTSAFTLAREESITLSSAFKQVGIASGPVGLALTAISVAVGVLAPKISDFVTKQQNAAKATTALADASKSIDMNNMVSSVSSAGTAAGISAKSIDELNESIVKTAESISERNAEAQEQIGTLNTALQYVQNYAGQTDLSAEAQGRLQWAISQVNDEFGTSITMSEAIAGSYTDQNGNVLSLKDSIYDLIEAKKQEIQLATYQDNYTDAIKAKTEAEATYAKSLQDWQNVYDNTYEQSLKQNEAYTDASLKLSEEKMQAAALTEANSVMGNKLKESKERLDEASKSADFYAQEMGTMAQAAEETAEGLDRWIGKLDGVTQKLLEPKGGVSGFRDDLETLGVSIETLESLTSEQLNNIALQYDGTALSIATALQGMNVELDEATTKTIEAAAQIAGAIEGLSGVSDALTDVGVNVNDFSLALADAGVGTETLNQIGAENLSALAETCNGNITQMVGSIQMYNAQPLLDKDGNVNVDDAKLIDAQGNVYTWNGSELLNKYGEAAVADTSVTDAQGHKLTWNGTDLEYKTADGVVHNFMQEAISARDTWNANGLANWVGSGTINIFKNITETVSSFFSGNAKGGIRTHASGGIFPRYHASGGAIATRAVPLDIVGEAGAEAIVPLTNQRYSAPFAKTLARQMDNTSSAEAVVQWLASNLGAIINSNVPQTIIDNDAGALIVDNRLNQLQRKAAMNVG